MSKIILKKLTKKQKILMVGLFVSFLVGIAGILMYGITTDTRYLSLLCVYVAYRIYLEGYKGE